MAGQTQSPCCPVKSPVKSRALRDGSPLSVESLLRDTAPFIEHELSKQPTPIRIPEEGSKGACLEGCGLRDERHSISTLRLPWPTWEECLRTVSNPRPCIQCATVSCTAFSAPHVLHCLPPSSGFTPSTPPAASDTPCIAPRRCVRRRRHRPDGSWARRDEGNLRTCSR